MEKQWGKVINKYGAFMWKTSYLIENYFFRVKDL